MNVFFYNSDTGIIPFNIKIAGIGNSTKLRGFIKTFLLRNSIHLEIIYAHVAKNLVYINNVRKLDIFAINMMVNSTSIMLQTPVSTSIRLSSTEISCHKSNHDAFDEHEHQNDIYTLSKFCVNGSDWSNLECIHDIDEQSFSRNILGIWAIIVSVVGIIGNVLTLLAVPFAADRKR